MKLGSLTAALAGLALLTTLGGCEGKKYEPPSEEEKVAQAEELYSPALFDTLSWGSDSLRLAQGNLVYADECRRCHGYIGEGETAYAEERAIEVPSLVAEDWTYAGDLEAVRRRIFVGHPTGMPNWGVGQLTPRQIDAAAFYILEQLRPEVLDGADGADATTD